MKFLFSRFGVGNRLPLVLQTETSECGIACLAMISSYYGRPLDMISLRVKLQSSSKGATLSDLVDFAGRVDLAGRGLRLELEDLNQLELPCILHWNMSHFVVLREVGARGLVIHDPAQGVRKITWNEASRHFTGVALELSPVPDFERGASAKGIRLGALMGKVSGIKRALLQVLAISFALEAVAVLAPFFQQWVLDHAISRRDVDFMQVLALGFSMLLVLQVVLSSLRTWMVVYFSTQINVQWSNGVLMRLFNLPMDYFFKRHLGDVMARFGAIHAIRQTLTTAALSAALDGMMAAIAFAVMWTYSPKLALVTLTALGAYVLVRMTSYQALEDASQEYITHMAKQETHFMESVRAMQSVKLFNREAARRNEWANLLINTTNRELSTQRLNMTYEGANALVFGIENIVVIYFGALMIMNKELSIGMMFAYAAFKLQFSTRITGLVNLFFKLRMLRIHRERLADIVLSEPEPQGGSAAPLLGLPDIEIRNLSFRYASTEPWILDNLSLRIEAGESVAIVGPSGCGKTTLLKIMLGLLSPTEGEVLINGLPLSSMRLQAWREVLGAVMQDDQLLAGTILDNVTFFASQADMQRAHECARIAAIEDDILVMPMGWQTLIGDMGAALSGGQKQRLLLARALYKQPGILFLDEATSHLDTACEHLVNAAVRSLKLTKVVIAHRPETIKSADRVIELKSHLAVSAGGGEKLAFG